MKLRYSSVVSFGEHHRAFIGPLLLAILFLGALFAASRPVDDTATLTLELGGQRRSFQGPVVSGATVLDALHASALAGGISLELSGDRSDMILVVSQGDREYRVSGQNISVSVNGRRIDPGEISRAPLNPRDTITIRIPLAPEE